jgi:hypothetical protein
LALLARMREVIFTGGGGGPSDFAPPKERNLKAGGGGKFIPGRSHSGTTVSIAVFSISALTGRFAVMGRQCPGSEVLADVCSKL